MRNGDAADVGGLIVVRLEEQDVCWSQSHPTVPGVLVAEELQGSVVQLLLDRVEEPVNEEESWWRWCVCV